MPDSAPRAACLSIGTHRILGPRPGTVDGQIVPPATVWVDLPTFGAALFTFTAVHMQQYIDHHLPPE